MSQWKPKRTFEECDQLMCAPGLPLELETRLISGQVQRVYKNQWPSARLFPLYTTNLHGDKISVVYEGERVTFREMLQRALLCASILRDVYGVSKGDRVGICSRNYPEFLVFYWGCHLLGAVPALINAWLPIDNLTHCITITAPKLVILDSERANLLVAATSSPPLLHFRFLVIAAHQTPCQSSWPRMDIFTDVIQRYKGDPHTVLINDPDIQPEDDAGIIFTSGTTGLPKGVLSSQRMLLTLVLNGLAAAQRGLLRDGQDLPVPEPTDAAQKSLLLPTPLFHITGITMTLATSLYGMKLVLMRKWDPTKVSKLAKTENIVGIGGVPSLVHDLTESNKVDFQLESVMLGGGPLYDTFLDKAKRAFPTATVSQAYGMTESNATAVAISGQDCFLRPKSCGKPLPCNDILVMNNKEGRQAKPNEDGEVWIRGPDVMKGYVNDPVATDIVLTRDGWLKTGDIGSVDEEGFLYIKDREKDIIIRGGENIDSTAVESAIFAAHPSVQAAAVVPVPDERYGELVVAFVVMKAGGQGMAEEDILKGAAERLPKFAVPVMILFADGFETTPSGKVIKPGLRKKAKSEWEMRKKSRFVPKL